MTTEPSTGRTLAVLALNQRTKGNERVGEVLMDALYASKIGTDLPAEEWDDLLVDLASHLLDHGVRIAAIQADHLPEAVIVGDLQTGEVYEVPAPVPVAPEEFMGAGPDPRHKALTEAWQAVDRAIRPLGYGGGATNSPWNKGYEQAKDEALNAILALRDA